MHAAPYAHLVGFRSRLERLPLTSRPPIRIISICDDYGLRESREMLLRSENYEVWSLSSADLPDVSVIRESDLAILCHSVSHCASGFRGLFRSHNPNIRFLDLHLIVDREVEGSGISMLSGPGFLRLVNAFLTFRREESGCITFRRAS